MNDSNRKNSLKHAGPRHTDQGRKWSKRIEKTMKTRERQEGKKEIMMILATEALLQKTNDGDFLILIERIGNVSIYDNATWNEYICKLDGNPDADYHTNRIEDARNTAQRMRTK